jgi:hypothetical protein
MSLTESARLSRRHALTLAGAAAGATLLPGSAEAAKARVRKQSGKLPAQAMQKILQAEGQVTDGVLSIDIARDDIGKVKGPLGVTFDGSFEVVGTLTFQPLGADLAFFNGDLPLKPSETQAFIDAIIANGLTFQAFHQHYIEFKPNVWFIHWRGIGAPLDLAARVHNTIKATGTKLPQTMPKKPKSPLSAERLGKILGGSATIGDEGVVTVEVQRAGRIVIDGVEVSPEANISTTVEIKPLHKTGSLAAVGPDVSMTSSEVMPVIERMRSMGWFIGCLYNQETQESPQLYFSHMLKVGDAYALAAEVRRGLELTKVKFK